jgi:hypothetical protein
MKQPFRDGAILLVNEKVLAFSIAQHKQLDFNLFLR